MAQWIVYVHDMELCTDRRQTFVACLCCVCLLNVLFTCDVVAHVLLLCCYMCCCITAAHVVVMRCCICLCIIAALLLLHCCAVAFTVANFVAWLVVVACIAVHLWCCMCYNLQDLLLHVLLQVLTLLLMAGVCFLLKH